MTKPAGSETRHKVLLVDDDAVSLELMALLLAHEGHQVFRANDAQVNGPGHGYYVQNKRLQTLVACNNEVSGAAGGLSTIVCTPL